MLDPLIQQGTINIILMVGQSENAYWTDESMSQPCFFLNTAHGISL